MINYCCTTWLIIILTWLRLEKMVTDLSFYDCIPGVRQLEVDQPWLVESNLVSCLSLVALRLSVAPGFTFHVPTSSSPKPLCALVKCLNTTSLNWLITLDCLWIYLPSGSCPRKPSSSVWNGFKKLRIDFPALPTNLRFWLTSWRTDLFVWLVWFYSFSM